MRTVEIMTFNRRCESWSGSKVDKLSDAIRISATEGMQDFHLSSRSWWNEDDRSGDGVQVAPNPKR